MSRISNESNQIMMMMKKCTPQHKSDQSEKAFMTKKKLFHNCDNE